MRQTAARLDAAPSRDVRPALLVVDDEEVLRHALRSYFSLEGFRVDTAGSVESALARMEERSGGGHAPYAAVISDLRLAADLGREGVAVRAGALALKPGAGHIVRTLIAAARRGPRFTHRSNLHVDPR